MNKHEDVIDTALLDMYQMGIRLGQGNTPNSNKDLTYSNKDEAKAAILADSQQSLRRLGEKIKTEVIGEDEPVNYEGMSPAKQNTNGKDTTMIVRKRNAYDIERQNELRAEQRAKLEQVIATLKEEK